MKLHTDIQRHVRVTMTGEVEVHLVITVGNVTRHTIGLGKTEAEADDRVERSFEHAARIVDRYGEAMKNHNRFDWGKAVQ